MSVVNLTAHSVCLLLPCHHVSGEAPLRKGVTSGRFFWRESSRLREHEWLLSLLSQTHLSPLSSICTPESLKERPSSCKCNLSLSRRSRHRKPSGFGRGSQHGTGPLRKTAVRNGSVHGPQSLDGEQQYRMGKARGRGGWPQSFSSAWP